MLRFVCPLQPCLEFTGGLFKIFKPFKFEIDVTGDYGSNGGSICLIESYFVYVDRMVTVSNINGTVNRVIIGINRKYKSMVS